MHSVTQQYNIVRNRSYDKKLEGLRGICAITVAISHLFSFNLFGAFPASTYSVVMHLQFARIAVLLFFILSGYVMGISHIDTPFSYQSVIDYLKKRAVRLYPIYLLALLISIAANKTPVSYQQIAGHVLFAQGFWVNVIASNLALWTLSYEVAYYLLFIPLWALNRYNKIYYLLLALVIVLYMLITPGFSTVKSVAIGWIFWLFGLYLYRSADIAESEIRFKPLISYLFILLATLNLKPGLLIMRLLHIDINNQERVVFNDLFYLPVCILIMFEITSKYYKYLNLLKVMVYLLPAVFILTLVYYKHNIASEEDWLYGVVFFVLSVPFLLLNVNIYALEKLAHLGRISYALYVLHFPLGYLLCSLLSHFMSSNTLLIFGTIYWIAATYSLAVLTELVWQPFLKRALLKKRVNTSVELI